MSFEGEKKAARELLRAIRAGSADALGRLRTQNRRWAKVDDARVRQDATLEDAQFAIALGQGLDGGTKRARQTRIFVADMEWMAGRVRGLVRARESAGAAALEQIRAWHPRFRNSTDEEILQAPFTEEDARLVYAREHGFGGWDELAERVNRLAADANAESGEPLLAAFRALESGNRKALERLLEERPQLTEERGTNGNTLLNLAVSTAAKGEANVGLAAVEMLLARGADVNEANDRGWTPLHQAAGSNQCAIVERLIACGADLEAEAHGSGGTPLIAALFWGHREAADLLGRHSKAPGNLRVAAGLGNEGLLEKCFRGEKTLTPEACAARGFYRPHSGFPDWRPSPDPQEVLDEALVWAAKSGRTGVLGRLLRGGARLDADPYRGTALIWAAVCNRVETAGWLIDHGAAVNQKATFGGATHGQGVTALHMGAQSGHLAMAQLLIERGADPTIQDDLYHGNAEGAANYFGQIAVRDYLRSLRS